MAWTAALRGASQANEIPLGPGMKMAFITVTPDNSYAAGPGETLDLSAIFPNEVKMLIPCDHDAEDAYHLKYQRAAAGAPATGKIIAYYYDYDAVADGDAIEVAGTTDLSALVGDWLGIGY